MGSIFLACCGGGRPKKERQHRRPRRRHHGAASARLNTVSASASVAVGSGGSDGDWHDARDAFSDSGSYIGDSAPASPRDTLGYEQGHYEDYATQSGSEGSSSYSQEGVENPPGLFSSCLSMVRDGKSPTGEQAHRAPSPFSKGPALRPPAGASFLRYDPNSAVKDKPCECWSESDSVQFMVRSQEYMRSKQKVNSEKAFYRLIAVDVFSTESKALHVAKHVVLPPTGAPVMVKSTTPGAPDVALPPLLIMNLQLPNYQPSFFGSNDGPGQSVVYYFALPEDFDPNKVANKAALGLLTRFVANGREADGSSTRERLKIIARVVNVEEWAQKGSLSATEFKLLQNYNEKPVLSRPQHFFYMGPNYLEVDLDIHSYAFLARKALASYMPRLRDVVWEVAFVVQGNAPEELPEQVMAAGCINRTDLLQAKPFTTIAHTLSMNERSPPEVTVVEG